MTRRLKPTHRMTVIRSVSDGIPDYESEPEDSQEIVVSDEPVRYNANNIGIERDVGGQIVTEESVVECSGRLAPVVREGDEVQLYAIHPNGKDITDIEIHGIKQIYGRRSETVKLWLLIEDI